MFCAKCGNQIDDAAVICPKCGVPVTGKRSPDANVSNHMVLAVLTTIFCCLIGGIIAIIYASQVNTKLAMGDIEGAKAASKTAKIWIIVNICTGLLGGLFYILAAIGAAL